jgi:GR25 family glycosyltransferase involved in LPS biosynthesis
MDIESSCLKYIDAILYINLEHRTDRNEHILNEIKKIDPTLSKTHRIDAISNADGGLGCSLSHIKALELCKESSWNNVVILEDDFTFLSNDSNEIHKSINHLFTHIPNYDMFLLSTGLYDFKYIDTLYPLIRKVLSSQTASGYIVNRNYLDKLLANFVESSNAIKREGRLCRNCLDQHWKILMPTDNWFTLNNRLGVQYESYSDIEKKLVNYNC